MEKLGVIISVGLSLMGIMAFALYDSGHRDISFIIAMSLAGVVVVAIADPKRFSTPDGGRRDYERETLYDKRPGPLDMLERQEKESKKQKSGSSDDSPNDVL